MEHHTGTLKGRLMEMDIKKITDSTISEVCNRVLNERFEASIRDYQTSIPEYMRKTIEDDPIVTEVARLKERVETLDAHVVEMLKADYHAEINRIGHDMQRIIDAICELRDGKSYDHTGMVNVELVAAKKEIAALEKSLANVTYMNAVLTTRLYDERGANSYDTQMNNTADMGKVSNYEAAPQACEKVGKSGSTPSRR